MIESSDTGFISPKVEQTRAGYREIDHQADRAVFVWASTPAELMEIAARAMFSLMADLRKITACQRHCVQIDYSNLEEALVDWLNELLFWRETREELYAEFQVRLEDGRLEGSFAGCAGHPTNAVIKAATFHDLKVRAEENGIWQAAIVFDT